MSTEELFSQYEWDQNEDEWHKLVSLWKERAQQAETSAAVLLAALAEAEVAMNHMGDDLNARDFDAGEAAHFEQVCFAFFAVRAALEEVKS